MQNPEAWPQTRQSIYSLQKNVAFAEFVMTRKSYRSAFIWISALSTVLMALFANMERSSSEAVQVEMVKLEQGLEKPMTTFQPAEAASLFLEQVDPSDTTSLLIGKAREHSLVYGDLDIRVTNATPMTLGQREFAVRLQGPYQNMKGFLADYLSRIDAPILRSLVLAEVPNATNAVSVTATFVDFHTPLETPGPQRTP